MAIQPDPDLEFTCKFMWTLISEEDRRRIKAGGPAVKEKEKK